MHRIFTAVFATRLLFFIPAALAHEGERHGNVEVPYGEPGNASVPSRDVVVAMTEGAGTMSFEPNRIEVRRGEQIRFVLRNDGKLDHEFFLGTEQEVMDHAEMMRVMPDMKHADPNSVSVASKARGSLIWHFTKTGEFAFACLIPGHSEAGMTGVILVK